MDDAADEPPLTERERIETDLIRSLIGSYFHIVRESIQDLVPKAIMHLLVNHCKEVYSLIGAILTSFRCCKQDLLQICTEKISSTNFSTKTRI
jgi:hypothetical protein